MAWTVRSARDAGLAMGVNVAGGMVTHPAVAEAVGEAHVPVEKGLVAAAEQRDGGGGRPAAPATTQKA